MKFDLWKGIRQDQHSRLPLDWIQSGRARLQAERAPAAGYRSRPAGLRLLPAWLISLFRCRAACA
jgi:hypothetical protein